ncbi:MAG: hypothetical protein M1828_004164 [Chrysothrix sp. TS-e1954]|nr:MAG: hypothetical protein M1828_004164 [Chrysothrix sp. TS-e1954]
MPFSSDEHLDIPSTDILSYIFDAPLTEHQSLTQPVFISAEQPHLSFTYAECRDLIYRLITGFAAIGIGKGDVVVIHSFNSVIYPLLALGIIGAGGVFAGTNPAYTSGELGHALKLTKAAFVFTEPDLLSSVEAAVATNQLFIKKDRIFLLDDQDVSHHPSSTRSWLTLLAHPASSSHSPPTSSDTTTAALFFSSGTTGPPKAVQITHTNLIAQHILTQSQHPRSYPISCIFATPIFHIGIGPLALISSLRERRRIVIMRRFTSPEDYCRLVARHLITECLIVPPIAARIVASGLADPQSGTYKPECSLRSMRYGLIGGAPCGAKVQGEMQALMGDGAVLGQLWGMTELTCSATQIPAPSAHSIPPPPASPTAPSTSTSTRTTHLGSAGHPIPNLTLRLVHPTTGADISPHTTPSNPGELQIRGPTLTRGYLSNPSATASLFTPDGFLKSGDIGYRDARTGLVYIVDRSKELIKVRGFQVSPAEIEEVVRGMDGVVDVAVVGVSRLGGVVEEGEVPRAYVVRQVGRREAGDGAVEISERSVQTHVRTKLASYKQLAGGVKFVAEVPRNASGKILRRVVRGWVKQEQEEAEEGEGAHAREERMGGRGGRRGARL